MANRNRFLGEAAQTVESRSRQLAKPLEAWLEAFSRAAADAEIKALQESKALTLAFQKNPRWERKIPSGIDKQAPPDLPELIEQLRQILIRFGITQLADAISLGAKTVGAQVSITDELVLEFIAEKDIKVQQIVANTLRDVQRSVRQIIGDAMFEDPRPSTTAIGRRIARQFHGSGFAPKPPADAAPIMGARVATTQQGNLYAFSADRAQLIARTEMVQTQNTGIVQGYRLSGVKQHKWVSYQDGRSGRGHDQMNGQTVDVGDFFTAPDGTKLRYPGDPSAPIKHTANCRCTTVPVISAQSEARSS